MRSRRHRSRAQTAQDQHSEEVERLKARLTEAEERSQRAIAQAQLTKSGFVYVLSNIGSFGENVFKVGMSRRLDPLERVRELSGAAVPFPFDVHMMIATNDAPALENALHRKLHKFRVNKTNPRKEYFKIDIQTILQVVTEHHGEVQYVADAEALGFRQSLTMSEGVENSSKPSTTNSKTKAQLWLTTNDAGRDPRVAVLPRRYRPNCVGHRSPDASVRRQNRTAAITLL